MERNLASYLTSAIFLMIFIFGIVSVNVYMAADNGRNATLRESQAIDKAFIDVNISLADTKSDVKDQESVFFNETDTKSITGEAAFPSAINIARSFRDYPVQVFNIVRGLLFEVGVPGLLMTGLLIIIGIMGITLIWKWWRSGN